LCRFINFAAGLLYKHSRRKHSPTLKIIMSWQWHCRLCGISCAQGSRESHIRGKKHQMNERRNKGQTRSALSHVSGNVAFTCNIQSIKPPANNITTQQSKVNEVLLQDTYNITKSPPQDDAVKVKKEEAPAVFPIFQPRKPKAPPKKSKFSEACLRLEM
jgi:hypothetical protein